MICKSWLRADKDAGAGAFLTKYLEALFNIGDMIRDTSAEYQQVQAVKSESCQCWKIVRTWIGIENNLHWPQAWDNVVISVPLWKPECLRGWGWWGEVRDEIEQTHSFTKWDAAPNLTHWVSYLISSDEYFLCTLLTSCSPQSFVSSPDVVIITLVRHDFYNRPILSQTEIVGQFLPLVHNSPAYADWSWQGNEERSTILDKLKLISILAVHLLTHLWTSRFCRRLDISCVCTYFSIKLLM